MKKIFELQCISQLMHISTRMNEQQKKTGLNSQILLLNPLKLQKQQITDKTHTQVD